MSLATLKRKTAAKYNNNSVGLEQFALNGTRRLQGYVGQTSLSRTDVSSRMSGNSLKGHGGCCGSYPTKVIKTQQTDKCLEDSSVVKDSTLNTRGMIREKYKWVFRGGEHAPAKPGDSNNFNYSSYATQKKKTDTLGSFDAPGCEILPGVVYPAPRSVRVDEMTTTIVYEPNPVYGVNHTNFKTKYGFDFRDPENKVLNSLKNKMVNNGDMQIAGGSLTAAPSGLTFADPTFNLDTIYVDKSNITFGNTTTLIVRFKINTYNSGAPGQVWRSIMHYAGPVAADTNKEVFSIKYLRENGTAAPHAGKSQGQLFVQWGVWNNNTFNGNYYHSTGTVNLDEFVTLIFEFNKGNDNLNPSGEISLKNAFLGNNINDASKKIAWASAENIQLNSTVPIDSGVWVASAVDDIFNPSKIIVGSNLDEAISPVGDNDANEEATGAFEISHLYVFDKELSNAEQSSFVTKNIIQPQSYSREDVSLDQNNILVRRAGTDQIWTQNRENYNHIDQSQYINRLKAKCTLEDSLLTVRNTKGTPFVGFN